MPSPAAWHPDPTGRHQLRYWNGSAWTEHVADDGTGGIDPMGQSRPPHHTNEMNPIPITGQHQRVSDSALQPGPQKTAGAPPAIHHEEKVTAWNAKRVATDLQAENFELRATISRQEAVLAEVGALEAVRLQASIDTRRREAQALKAQCDRLTAELDDLRKRIVWSRDTLQLEEVGLFDYEHPAESSVELATALEALRSEIRQINKIGTAVSAVSSFTFNNSAAKGKTFVNQMSRIMLRAYNAEAENSVKTVRAGNLAAAQKRLSSAREQIARQGQMIDLQVTQHYHLLRLRELDLAARHMQAKAAERELERERREQLREQRLLEQEVAREKERLDKERTHYLNAISRLRESGDAAGAEELQAELDRIDREIAEADYRAANIRAGYVYVISNIGAFGEEVVKIGMTRRLEPMDRIRELGDASVPFGFDVHALFFSEDAVGVEAMLHREFAAERVNKVNQRREFFRVQPSRVLEALNQHKVSVLEFTTHADADDFRLSWPDGYPATLGHPLTVLDS